MKKLGRNWIQCRSVSLTLLHCKCNASRSLLFLLQSNCVPLHKTCSLVVALFMLMLVWFYCEHFFFESSCIISVKLNQNCNVMTQQTAGQTKNISAGLAFLCHCCWSRLPWLQWSVWLWVRWVWEGDPPDYLYLVELLNSQSIVSNCQ